MSDSIVSDDMRITDEWLAWSQVAETLAKPSLQRSDVEVSRAMTLLKNMSCFKEMAAQQLLPTFAARLQLIKAARYVQVAPGVVVLNKGNEGDTETIIDIETGFRSTTNVGGGSSAPAPPSPRSAQNASAGRRSSQSANALAGNNPNIANNTNLSRTNSFSSLSPNTKQSIKDSERDRTGALGSSAFGDPSSGPSSGSGGVGGTNFNGTINKTGGSVAMTSSVAVIGASELSEGGADTRMVYIIIRGEVVLERPTINGRVRTEVHAGEVIGNRLEMDALPSGAYYLSTTETHLLGFPWRIYEQCLKDFDEAAILKRVQFFREGLVVPVFTPFAEARYRWLARCCFTIHLQAKEIAVREGDLSDYVYFIVSGKMKVIREIDFSSALSADKNGTLGGTVGSITGASSSSNNPTNVMNLKLLDLATLEQGEYFGELGVIRHRVDEASHTSVEQMLTITAEDIETVDQERELTMIDLSIEAIPRQATVYADTPATLLAISRAHFVEVVQLGALVRIREYAKGYPSAAVIRQHFTRQHKWNAFKTKVYEEDYKR